MTVICQYCGAAAAFRPTSSHVYSKDFGPIWHCVPCAAWVGCHPDGRPLGTLANANLRKIRVAAHNAFNPLIERKIAREKCSKTKAKNAAYAWLSKQLGIPREQCHIGMFNEEQCSSVMESCARYAA
jgi:hypothetical protein